MLSTRLSSKVTSLDGSCPSPVSSSLTPISTASLSFSLPSGPATQDPLKAAPRTDRESSLCPLEGTEGTGSSGSGSPGLGFGAGFADATEGAIFSAVSLQSRRFLPPFRSVVSLDVLVVLHGVAGTQRLKISATRNLKHASPVDCFDDIFLLCPCLLLQLPDVA